MSDRRKRPPVREPVIQHRRKRASVVKPPAPPAQPVLEPTADSVNRLASWVAAELGAGRLKPYRARELVACGKAVLSAIRVDKELSEMARLQDLVKRAEDAANRRKANAVEDRFAQGATQDFGRILTEDLEKKN